MYSSSNTHCCVPVYQSCVVLCVFAAAATVLKLAPGDADALSCKAVALLQEQEYEAADKVLQHKALQGKLPLERVRLWLCIAAISLTAESSSAAVHGANVLQPGVAGSLSVDRTLRQ